MPPAQFEKISVWTFPAINCYLPGQAVPENLHWPSIQFMQKGRDATWNHYPLTPVSLSDRWTSRMWNQSKGSPAIAIEQRTASHNPRLLWAQSRRFTITSVFFMPAIGVVIAIIAAGKIRSQTIDSIVENILALPENTRFSILAPLVCGKKVSFKKSLKNSRKKDLCASVSTEK